MKHFSHKSPRVKSNLLFNRRKPGAGRSKFAGKISSPLTTAVPTTTSTTEGATDTADVPTTTPESQQEPEEETKTRKKTGFASRFHGRRPSGGLFGRVGHRPPVSFANSLLAKRKLQRSKENGREVTEVAEEEVDATTQPAPIATSTVFTAFGSSSSSFAPSPSSPTSSVEEELLADEESIDNEITPEERPAEKGRSVLAGFRKPRKWPSVKKAKVSACQTPLMDHALPQSSPANGNIRVEFKKATAVAEEEGSRSTFVKPDGRKPRVKANIRARWDPTPAVTAPRKAHRGVFGQPAESSALTGFRHSTKVTPGGQICTLPLLSRPNPTVITAIAALKHDRGYQIDHMTETCDFLIILAQVTTNEEAFAEASSQLALAPPYTPEEEDEEDNTEKREIMEAEGPNDIDSQDVQSKGQSFIHLPNLQPVILNSRQERRRGPAAAGRAGEDPAHHRHPQPAAPPLRRPALRRTSALPQVRREEHRPD